MLFEHTEEQPVEHRAAETCRRRQALREAVAAARPRHAKLADQRVRFVLGLDLEERTAILSGERDAEAASAASTGSASAPARKTPPSREIPSGSSGPMRKPRYAIDHAAPASPTIQPEQAPLDDGHDADAHAHARNAASTRPTSSGRVQCIM